MYEWGEGQISNHEPKFQPEHLYSSMGKHQFLLNTFARRQIEDTDGMVCLLLLLGYFSTKKKRILVTKMNKTLNDFFLNLKTFYLSFCC